MLLSLLGLPAPSFTTYRETGAVSKNVTVTDRADMIFEVTKFSKIQFFRGSAPDPTGGAYWDSFWAYIASLDLLAGGEGTRCPSPISK